MFLVVGAAGLGASVPAAGAALRGYEMVSPPEKNGGDVAPHSNRMHAASDGSAATFMSLSGFADVHGTGIGTEYMSIRTAAPGTRGWATHGITPPQLAMNLFGAVTIGGEVAYEAEMAPDLSQGIVRAWSPLTDVPTVADVQNLYVRSDLRTPGVGSYTLVSACPACDGGVLPASPAKPAIGAASDDFQHVLFESRNNLTGDGAGVKAYVASNGVVRLVGLVPAPGDTRCGGAGPTCVVAQGSMAGMGASKAFYTPRTLSSDGGRAIITSSDGNAGIVVFPPEERSKIYVRDFNGTAAVEDDTTTQLNVSERETPTEPGVALYENASVDSRVVLFRSDEALTDTVSPDSLPHLYRWDQDHPNDEVQKVVVSATGGTFTLTLNGDTTAALAAGAGPNEVASALNQLPSIIATGARVVVHGGPGDVDGSNPYFVQFGGGLAGVDVPLITGDATNLTGGSPAAAVTVLPWVKGGGHLTALDVDLEPADLPGEAVGVLGASADAEYVYFVAVGQIVPGAPALDTDRGIYLWHAGMVRYIGSFVPASVDWSMNLNTNWSLPPIQSRVTNDGKNLLFAATDGSRLTGYDHQGTRQFYLYSAQADSLVCVSCKDGGGPIASASIDVRTDTGAANPTAHMSAPLTQNGKYVFFSTPTALLPADTNGQGDVYAYDGVERELSMISPGKSKERALFLDASDDGEDVFFVTRERLVGWDVDFAYDLYDARVNGGFPEPVSPPTACIGPACQGPLPPSPDAGAVGSSKFGGVGDAEERLRPRSQKKCRRGTARRNGEKRGRCTRRRKHARNPRAAAMRSNRGGSR